MSHPVLENIKTRRVIRSLTDEPVEHAQLEQVLKAGRWAPSGGNRRPHRFVAIEDPLTMRVIRMVCPGMFQRPAAAILICIDWDEVAAHEIPRHDKTVYIDVGTAAQTMMLAAHALGLASGPVTSFSQEAVRVVLNLPQNLSPEMFICLGHAAPPQHPPIRPWRKITWQDLTYWERFPQEG